MGSAGEAFAFDTVNSVLRGADTGLVGDEVFDTDGSSRRVEGFEAFAGTRRGRTRTGEIEGGDDGSYAARSSSAVGLAEFFCLDPCPFP